MSRQDRQQALDAGAVATEYALLAGLIAVVIAGSVFLFGQAVLGLFQSVPPLF